jgi:hypothetical protein
MGKKTGGWHGQNVLQLRAWHSDRRQMPGMWPKQDVEAKKENNKGGGART